MIARITTYLSFVRFSHSVFALPFALAGALLAARHTPITWPIVGWILVAMVAARSAAQSQSLQSVRLHATMRSPPTRADPTSPRPALLADGGKWRNRS